MIKIPDGVNMQTFERNLTFKKGLIEKCVIKLQWSDLMFNRKLVYGKQILFVLNVFFYMIERSYLFNVVFEGCVLYTPSVGVFI